MTHRPPARRGGRLGWATALLCALLALATTPSVVAAPAASPEVVGTETELPADPLDPPVTPQEALAVAEEATSTEPDRGQADVQAPQEAIPEATLALRDLWLARDDLHGADRRRARALLARPDTAAADPRWRYPSTVVPQRTCDSRICVVHVASGHHAATEAWVTTTLRLVGEAWRGVVDERGYRAPAPDAGLGGDDRFDVYLADLGPGLYGYCAPERLVPGQPARATAYCVLDNDMAGLGQRPTDALAATAAHEFFHAVQFNYDVAEDLWFMETTATWMESQVFGAVHDNTQFLADGQLGRPRRPLDYPSAAYGNWIFAQFLAQRHGDDTIRRIWDRLDASTGARDEWSLQGVRAHLSARGDSWPRAYADFVRVNQRPGRHYAGGAAYPRAAPSDRVRLRERGATRSVSATLPHLTSRTLKVAVPGTAKGRRTVRLEVTAGRPTYAAVQVLVQRRDGRTSLRRVRLDRRGEGAVRIRFAARKVRHLVVLTSHSGAAHRNCGRNSGWACGGDPVGTMRVELRATRLR